MPLSRLKILKTINKYIKKSKWSVVILIIASIITVPTTMISPYFFSILIDKVMQAHQLDQFKFVVMGLLSVYVLRFILDLLNLKCSNIILNRFTYNIRKDIWNIYFKLNMADYENKDTGDLKMRIFDDVDTLGNFLNDQVVDYIFNLLMIAFNFTAIMYINWKLTLICLTIIPFVFLINNLIGTGTKKVNEEVRQVSEKYYTFEHNALQFWKEIKAQNVEKDFINRFRKFRQILSKLGMKSITFWVFGEIFGDFKANYLTQVFIYVTGAFFIINGELSLGVLMMFSNFYALLFTSLDEVNKKNVSLRVNTPYYSRIFEILGYSKIKENNKCKHEINGNISVSNLEFKYNENSDYVLNDINIKIQKGDYLAVVGKSGCGKTTLVKLLLNLYNLNSGNIRLDEIDINNISKKYLYKQIGVVMQDSYLFNISIKENLLMAKQNANDIELQAACRQSNILDFIESLPEGFNTVVGERGIKLSGGQKQRIIIAQALLKQPKLIIFDEATSSLDKISEDIINKSINNIAEDTTVIVISHKPSTVLKAKRILVMENGMIVADGTHNGLIKTNEFYKKMAI
jgi:ABC-type bacteriocin/lantibiotic exporter with double-glycine peptidase domain